MISSLRIKRWKSHSDSQVSFGKGSNLFVGQMGSGKTSILEAVCFSLFGTFPALKARKVSLEDIVMQRPQACTDAVVSLDFEANGKKYCVERVVKLGKNGAPSTEGFLREDNRLLEGPQTQRVTETVQSLLKVDYDLFGRTVYSEQNRIDYFITLTKADRKKQADELLGIDKFELVRSNAGTLGNRLRAMESEAKSFLAGADVSGLEKDFAETTASTQALDTEIKTLKENFAAKENECAGESLAFGELEKQRLETSRLQNEASSARGAAQEGQKRLEEKKLQATGLEKETGIGLARAQEAFSKAFEEFESTRLFLLGLQKDLGEATALIKSSQGKISELEKKALERELLSKAKEKEAREYPGGLSAAIAQAKTLAQQFQNSINEASGQIISIQTAVNSLSHAQAQCPVCNAPLDEEHKKTLNLEKQGALSSLEQKKASAQKLLEEHNKQLEELEEKRRESQRDAERLSELLNVQKELDETRRQKALDEERKKRAEENSKKTAALMQESQNALEKLRGLKDLYIEISSVEKNVSLAKEKLNACEQRLSALSFSEEKHSNASKKLRETQAQAATLKAQVQANETLLSEKKRVLAEISKKLEGTRKKQEEASELAAKAESMAIFQNAVIETQAQLRETLVSAVNEALASTWALLYPYADYSSLRLNAAQDYGLELLAKDGNWTSIENASGGEKACASLALRVAFAMVLTPNLSWLVLDEPTHNLDSEAVEKLVTALHNDFPKIFEQTFIITHDEALKEGANAKIYRINRDKEHGLESSIEELPVEA